MKLLTVFFLGTTSLLFACHGANNNSANTESPNDKSAMRSLEHRSPGKTAAPVNVSYQFLDKPSLSAPLRIEISMTPLVVASAIKLEYTIKGNMNSVDPSTQASFAGVVVDQVTKHTIQVVPQGEGQHYVNLFVTLVTQDGQSQSTALMIPVTVGVVPVNQKPEQSNQGIIQQNSQGQPIIIVPAQETRQ